MPQRRSHNTLFARRLKGSGVNPKSFVQFIESSIKLQSKQRQTTDLRIQILEAKVVIRLLS